MHYLQIIMPSLPFQIVGMVAGAILRAHGDARRVRMATIRGALVIAGLAPILTFAPGLDLTGAALASVAAGRAVPEKPYDRQARLTSLMQHCR